MTMPASPATDVDGPYRISMPCPATVRTQIVAVIRRVEMEAGRTSLAGVDRVYPFHRNPCPLGFVGNERGELVERPGSHHAVVFAGLDCLAAIGTTACACRALADTSELFETNSAYALRLGMQDDLAREFVVGIAHPALLFTLA